MFDGRDLLKASARERCKIIGKDVAMVFQDVFTSLNPSYTVGYQIKEVLKLHEGLRGDALNKRALDLLRSAFRMRRAASTRFRIRCRAA